VPVAIVDLQCFQFTMDSATAPEKPINPGIAFPRQRGFEAKLLIYLVSAVGLEPTTP
jgi:hypothetical protein